MTYMQECSIQLWYYYSLPLHTVLARHLVSLTSNPLVVLVLCSPTIFVSCVWVYMEKVELRYWWECSAFKNYFV